MSSNTTLEIVDRYNPEAGTCNRDALYKGYLDGFFGKFQDSFFYTFVIQFLIVALMYANVGKGRYWKVLFYAALAGLLGSFVENGTVAFICLKSNENVNYGFIYPFIICELFWIPCEYAVPYLNLIKMKAFAKGTLATTMKYLILGLIIPFSLFRGMIGYYRGKRGYLLDEDIHTYHGLAFGIMALADIICTFSILYFVRKNNKQCALKATNINNINNYVKHSSYTILVCVDVVSVFLSTLNILTNFGALKGYNNIITPLHCLKCSFPLILAADAFIFKYGANVSSIHESSGNNSRTYGNGNDSSTSYKGASYKPRSNYKLNSSINKSSSNFDLSTSSINKTKFNQSMINVSPYNYPVVLDTDIYPRSPEPASSSYTSKSIIKNYTNKKIPSSIYEHSPTDTEKTIEVKVYQPQPFGFLNQQSNY